MQDWFNRRHGLQTHLSSPRQVPPFAVNVPSIVKLEAAHFRFFILICGPAAGSAVSTSSSSTALSLLISVALIHTSSFFLFSLANLCSTASTRATSLLFLTSPFWARNAY